MKTYVTTYTSILMHTTRIVCSIMCCAILSVLMACQDDTDEMPSEVKVRLFGKDYVEVTRSDGYTLLGSSFAAFTAGLYVTMDDQQAWFPMEWNGTAFSRNIFLEKGEYTFYSCIPLREENTSLVNATSTTSATLTLTEIPGLGTDDIMISNAAVVKDITQSGTINVPMKMDHIMACVSPQFYLDATYAAMRSIEILSVEFAIFEGENVSIPCYDAIAIYDDAEGTAFSIEWSPDDSKSDSWVKVYEAADDASKDILPNTKNNALALGNCYVSPILSTEHLKMRVTYNVYDKEGVLVREKVQAVNSIKKLSSLSQEKTLVAGNNYKLYIQIVPSYLYVLSDNDEASAFVIPDE